MDAFACSIRLSRQWLLRVSRRLHRLGRAGSWLDCNMQNHCHVPPGGRNYNRISHAFGQHTCYGCRGRPEIDIPLHTVSTCICTRLR